jgi:hypothetical protein
MSISREEYALSSTLIRQWFLLLSSACSGTVGISLVELRALQQTGSWGNAQMRRTVNHIAFVIENYLLYNILDLHHFGFHRI